MCESFAKSSHWNSHLLSSTEVSGVSIGYIGSVRQMDFIVMMPVGMMELHLRPISETFNLMAKLCIYPH